MRRIVVWLWPPALTLLIVAPLLGSGFVLTYDMVFVPDQAWRIDYLGLGPAVPRAVPSDALVSVASILLPGDVLQKVLLLLVFLGAGLGMLMLMHGAPLTARLAGVSWFVWNPFVAERLTIGQWVALVGYAALPWVAAAAIRARRRSTTACGGLVLAMAVGATSASGGLLAAGVGLAVLVWRGSQASRLQRWAVAAGALAVNAPWIVAGVLHRDELATNSQAVEAFAASGEGRLPTIGALASLGGIWNTDTVPESRRGWVAVAWLVVLVVVVALGYQDAIRHVGRGVLAALLLVAAVCVVVSLAGTVDDGVVAGLSSDVPGLALLRDGTRYLGVLALVEAIAFGFGAARLAAMPPERAVGTVVGVGLTLAPLAVMPDLGWGVGGRLKPVDYPGSWGAARDALVEDGGDGRVLVLPDAPYRAYPWNDDRPLLDPAPRFFPGQMLASDALSVDGEKVQGDDSTTAAAVDAFDRGDAAALRDLRIGYVVVDASQEDLRDEAAAVDARVVFASDDIGVYALAPTPDATTPRRDLVAVAAAWLAAFLACAAALGTTVRRGVRRGSRSAQPG